MTELLIRLMRRPQGFVGVVLLALIAAACLFGSALAPYADRKSVV